MRKTLSVLLFLLSVCSYMLVYSVGVQSELSNKLLRFHIIANSDSESDQSIKLRVRDYVSEALAGENLSPNSIEYIQKAEQLANDYLCKNAVPYKAKATREHIFIPKKSYKNITLPSGRYDAVRLRLGEGEGENWWCVAYPALCFREAKDGEMSNASKKELQNMLSEESYSVITDEVEYRLFIVDYVSKIMEKL